MSIDTCLAAEGRLLSLDEGLRLILADITPLAHKERLPLKTAHGRVLAEDVPAAVDLPIFSNSAMDGYALRAADTSAGETRLAMIGTSWAGKPYNGSVGPGQCVRIFTGAALPEGADAVAMQEDVALENGGIRLAGPLKPGKNVRQAGEELRRGEPALATGKRLLPAELALLAAMGLSEVVVKTKPRVAFFSTGDELRGVGGGGGPLRPGQIYDSNRYAMDGMLWETDADTLDMGAVADEPIALRSALLQAAAMADVVVTTGGVSVGDADFVTGVLAEIGQVKLWKLAIKPGKPIAFGRIGQAWFFGLPGNPVAVMVTFLQLLRPALDKLAGIPPRQALRFAALSRQALKKSPGRAEFLRGRLQRDGNGQWWVSSVAAQGSHMLSGMSQADCLIVLPAECAGVAEGEAVEVEPLSCHWR